MKASNNITVRHLLGGFLGSVTGILIAGYTKPHSVALACFGLVFGTIAGYLLGHWFDEIAKECLGAHARLRAFWRTFNTSRIAFIRNITNAINVWWSMWTGRFGLGLRSLSPVLYYVGKGILWLLLSPVHITAWLVGRPKRSVITLRALVLFSVLIISLTLSYTFFPMVGSPGGYDRFLVAFFPMLFVGLLTFCPFEESVKCEETVQRYQKEGPLYYASKEFLLTPLRFLWVGIFACGICIILALAVPLVVVGVLANVIIGGILWGLWKVTFRKGYLIGLSVTLFITVASAIINWGHLHGFLLWVVAIGTGVISGTLAEGVRRFSSYILPKIVREKMIKEDPFDTVEFIGKLMWRRTRPFRKWLGSILDGVVSSRPVMGFTAVVTGH